MQPSSRELCVSLSSIRHICFLSTSCILKEILLGYRPVVWLNLLGVVCVSSTLRTQCCGAACADGNPRDQSFKTWQWMQQQQSPLLTADKDSEGQLLSFRLSGVTGYNTWRMMILSWFDFEFFAPVGHKRNLHFPTLSGFLLHNKWSLQS